MGYLYRFEQRYSTKSSANKRMNYTLQNEKNKWLKTDLSPNYINYEDLTKALVQDIAESFFGMLIWLSDKTDCHVITAGMTVNSRVAKVHPVLSTVFEGKARIRRWVSNLLL
jgi:hypothetical protein